MINHPSPKNHPSCPILIISLAVPISNRLILFPRVKCCQPISIPCVVITPIEIGKLVPLQTLPRAYTGYLPALFKDAGPPTYNVVLKAKVKGVSPGPHGGHS